MCSSWVSDLPPDTTPCRARSSLARSHGPNGPRARSFLARGSFLAGRDSEEKSFESVVIQGTGSKEGSVLEAFHLPPASGPMEEGWTRDFPNRLEPLGADGLGFFMFLSSPGICLFWSHLRRYHIISNSIQSSGGRHACSKLIHSPCPGG